MNKDLEKQLALLIDETVDIDKQVLEIAKKQYTVSNLELSDELKKEVLDLSVKVAIISSKESLHSIITTLIDNKLLKLPKIDD